MVGRKRIVVAMSGGVDSASAAALLKGAGHEVVGVTLQLYDYGVSVGKKGACCAGQDIYDAQVAAEQIGIPHYVLNYEKQFKQAVIDDFVDSYLQGFTPIPCVRCNQKIKFQDLLKVAQDLGADALATGHYVCKRQQSCDMQLHKGSDPTKDQSYFLFTTTKKQLEMLLFPVGHMNKQETRQLAKKYNLPVADKPDSQDICFVPEGGYSRVINRLRPEAFTSGDIVFKNGTILGKHNGIANYTIGQRRGINIAYNTPLYVLRIDPHRNQVVVGYKEDLYSTQLTIEEINWLGDGEQCPSEFTCTVKLRSMHTGCLATIRPISNSKAKVTLFDGYYGITPGQACVMYDDTRVLGGGWISR